MTIKQEKVTGLWGDRSVAIEKDGGLLLWSDVLDDLSTVIETIGNTGEIFVGEAALKKLLKTSPDEVAMMLLPNTTIRLLANQVPYDQLDELKRTNRDIVADEVKACLQNGGFVARDKQASRATAWFAAPNRDRGGH